MEVVYRTQQECDALQLPHLGYIAPQRPHRCCTQPKVLPAAMKGGACLPGSAWADAEGLKALAAGLEARSKARGGRQHPAVPCLQDGLTLRLSRVAHLPGSGGRQTALLRGVVGAWCTEWGMPGLTRLEVHAAPPHVAAAVNSGGSMQRSPPVQLSQAHLGRCQRIGILVGSKLARQACQQPIPQHLQVLAARSPKLLLFKPAHTLPALMPSYAWTRLRNRCNAVKA